MGGFVSWLHSLRFLHECNSRYGDLTLTPVGLSPTEHASLRWTHSFANNRSGYKLLCCNAFITVVESAELWNGNDLSVAQRLSRKRTLFIEAQMGSRTMVVAEVTRQRSFEMARIQNHVVVQTFPSNGSD